MLYPVRVFMVCVREWLRIYSTAVGAVGRSSAVDVNCIGTCAVFSPDVPDDRRRENRVSPLKA